MPAKAARIVLEYEKPSASYNFQPNIHKIKSLDITELPNRKKEETYKVGQTDNTIPSYTVNINQLLKDVNNSIWKNDIPDGIYESLNNGEQRVFEGKDRKYNKRNPKPKGDKVANFEQEEDTVENKIHNSMSMKEARRMIERAWKVGLEKWYDEWYKNVDEFIAGEGIDEAIDRLETTIDNNEGLQNDYVNSNEDILNEEYLIGDVIRAYFNNNLKNTDGRKPLSDIEFKEGEPTRETFYSQKDVSNPKELWTKASERITKENEKDVLKARADAVVLFHNPEAISELGITQSEINKKIRQWARYSVRAREISHRLNEGVPREYQWVGLENSNILSRYNLTNEQIAEMVGDVTDFRGDGYGVKELGASMLSFDGSINYKTLDVVFEDYAGAQRMLNEQHAAGTYNRSHSTINIGNSGEGTVPHELGHFLDNLWGREISNYLLGNGQMLNNYLSHMRNMDVLKNIENSDVRSFVENFYAFMDNLKAKSDIRSEYSQKDTEIFARFCDFFTSWVQKTAGGFNEIRSFYNDNFNVQDCYDFVKLLQQKNMLNATVLTEQQTSTKEKLRSAIAEQGYDADTQRSILNEYLDFRDEARIYADNMSDDQYLSLADDFIEKYGDELFNDLEKISSSHTELVNGGYGDIDYELDESESDISNYNPDDYLTDKIKTNPEVKSIVEFKEQLKKAVENAINETGSLTATDWPAIQKANPELVEQFRKFEKTILDWGYSVEESLDELSPERKELDDEILGRYYNSITENKAKGKKASIVLGPPASGKSTIFSDVLEKQLNAVVLDSDKIKELLPEFEKYGGIMANYVHNESALLAEQLYDQLLYEGYNVVFPLVGKTQNNISSLIDKLKKAGYTDIGIYDISLPTDNSIGRALSRFVQKDRFLPIGYLEKVGNNPDKTFEKLKNKEGVTYYEQYDNNVAYGESPILIQRRGTPQISRSVAESFQRGVQETETENRSERGSLRILRGNNQQIDESNDSFSYGEGLEANARAVEENGAFDYGRNPSRNLDIARETEAGPTSRFWNNLANSEYVSDEEATRIQSIVGQGLGSYVNTTNSKQRTQARKMIRELGLEDSLKYAMNSDSLLTADIDTVFCKELLSEMNQKGLSGTDYYHELEAKIAWRSTMTGQALQAFNTFRTQSPEGQVITIRSEINRIQQSLAERYGEGAYDVKPNEELIEKYLRARNQNERDSIREEIAKDVAKQIPPTALEQLNSFRHLSMLFNPRTWIKNRLANTMFGYVNEGTRMVRSVLETLTAELGKNENSIFHGMEREAGVYNPFSEKDRALFKRFKTEYGQEFKNIDMKYSNVDAGNLLLGTEFGEQVANNRDAFTSSFLNKISDINAKMMSDAPGMSTAYAKSLVGYLKANNLDIDTMDEAQIQKAKEFAINEAKYATFNSVNKLANDISIFANSGGRARKIFIESLLPFKRTPLNLLRTGFRYTPAGLVVSLKTGLDQVKSGKITATQFIDNVSQGLTGSALVGLGFLLSQLGIFKTKDDDKDRKQYFDQENGEQEYSINWDGGSYTIDWFDPMIVPLAMGAELEKVRNNGVYTLKELIDLISSIADPMFETSMLSGIQKNLSNYSTGTTQWWGKIAENIVTNFASQYVPSILGATARTIDDTRRSTYTNKGQLDKFARTTLNKIPGLSRLNEPYINRKGQEERNEDLGIGIAGRAILNFISPGYYSSKDIDEYDEELYRLFNETGEIDSLPSNSTDNLTYQGENYKFNSEEYTEWQQTRWQTEADYVNDFIDSDIYKKLNDSERVETIKDIRSYAQKVAKKNFLNSKGIEYNDDKQLNNAQGAIDNGIELYHYYDYLNNSGSKQAEKLQYLIDSDLSEEAKKYLWDINGYKTSFEDAYAKIMSGTNKKSSSKKKTSSGSKKKFQKEFWINFYKKSIRWRQSKTIKGTRF